MGGWSAKIFFKIDDLKNERADIINLLIY